MTLWFRYLLCCFIYFNKQLLKKIWSLHCSVSFDASSFHLKMTLMLFRTNVVVVFFFLLNIRNFKGYLNISFKNLLLYGLLFVYCAVRLVFCCIAFTYIKVNFYCFIESTIRMTVNCKNKTMNKMRKMMRLVRADVWKFVLLSVALHIWALKNLKVIREQTRLFLAGSLIMSVWSVWAAHFSADGFMNLSMQCSFTKRRSLKPGFPQQLLMMCVIFIKIIITNTI